MRIPGVAGEVSTKSSFFSGFTYFVDGQPVTPHGFPRNRLTLPGTEGPVEARIVGGLFRAHPTLVVDDVQYPTGPMASWSVQIVSLLPLLGLLVVQGGLGFVVAFGGVVINMGIVRGERTDRAKIGLMLAVLAGAAAADAAMLAAILADG